ncbi:MAG: hypothetical protein LHV69_09825 [Elusimicrobia bacterium]|nr:hypothetical protein [Candidatus Obscuribacterium magneticum]
MNRNVISNNAYRILGLDASASQRLIQRRSKEIIAQLKIDSKPVYDLDLTVLGEGRNETSVKEAVQRLSSPRSRIKEYFFWFHLNTSDTELQKCLKENNLIDAVQKIRAALSENGYGRHLCIINSILLITHPSSGLLSTSLDDWKQLIESDRFWNYFFQNYRANDELGTDDSILAQFRSEVVSYLSDLYTHLSLFHGNSRFAKEFSVRFGTKGNALKNELLSPLYKELGNACEELENLKLSKEPAARELQYKQIQSVIKTSQSAINNISELGAYDDGDSKSIRDRLAGAIRSISLRFHNEFNDIDRATKLLQFASVISGTAGLDENIKADLDTLAGNKKAVEIASRIQKATEKGSFSEALQIIEQERLLHPDDKDLHEFLNGQKKVCVSLFGARDFKLAHELFEKQKWDESRPLFIKARSTIYDNIDLFNLNKKVVDEIISDINGRLANVSDQTVNAIDQFRAGIVEVAKEKYEDQFEGTVLIILIDTFIYAGLVDYLKKKRSEKQFSSAIGWIVVAAIVIALKSCPSSTSTPTNRTSSTSSSATSSDTQAMFERATKTLQKMKEVGLLVRLDLANNKMIIDSVRWNKLSEKTQSQLVHAFLVYKVSKTAKDQLTDASLSKVYILDASGKQIATFERKTE